MTKTIKSIAVASVLISLIGGLFKLSHWPGADVLLTTGFAAAILFLVLLLVSLRGKGAGGFEQFTGMFAAVVVIIVYLAFIFKLLHLAGAAKLIWVSDLGLLLACLFFLADGFLEKDHAKSGLKFLITFVILFVFLLSIFIQ